MAAEERKKKKLAAEEAERKRQEKLKLQREKDEQLRKQAENKPEHATVREITDEEAEKLEREIKVSIDLIKNVAKRNSGVWISLL